MIRHSRLTALGMVLCLLAALFAVEAKIAWFSPAGSGAAQVSAAKARPAEQPKPLPVRFTLLDAPSQDFARVEALLASVLVLVTAAVFFARVLPERKQVTLSPAHTAALFFRPPPSL